MTKNTDKIMSIIEKKSTMKSTNKKKNTFIEKKDEVDERNGGMFNFDFVDDENNEEVHTARE